MESTLAIVKTCQVSPNHKPDKLAEFLGWEKEPANDSEKVMALGFRLFVDRMEVLRKFLYHAGIRGSYTLEDNHFLDTESYKVVDYTGHIPAFAIKNTERLTAIMPQMEFTIHSMQPLPVEKRRVQVDPVMVGWLSDDVGVVVAIWDGDKEIEVL